MKRPVTALLALLALTATGAAAQLQTPSHWRVRTDAPVTVGNDAAAGMYFVAMPPGWHVTSRSGALLYDPAHEGRGQFSLETEIFLFNDSSDDGYGLFLGGTDLDGAQAPSYTAFLLRRDGAAGVVRRTGASVAVLADWIRHDAVARFSPTDTDVKNAIRVDVKKNDVDFSVNGQLVTTLPRDVVRPDGRFGFRVGERINIHASALNVTHRLAPIR